jgi:hypothetical protein
MPHHCRNAAVLPTVEGSGTTHDMRHISRVRMRTGSTTQPPRRQHPLPVGWVHTHLGMRIATPCAHLGNKCVYSEPIVPPPSIPGPTRASTDDLTKRSSHPVTRSYQPIANLCPHPQCCIPIPGTTTCDSYTTCSADQLLPIPNADKVMCTNGVCDKTQVLRTAKST